MELKEFIECYKSMDKDILCKINIRKYIPLEEKMEICQSIIDKTKDFENSTYFIKTKELSRFFDILLSYSDLIVNDIDKNINIYDDCMSSGIDKLIIRVAGRDDVDRFNEIFNSMMAVNDTLLIKESLLSVGSADLEKESKLIEDIISDNKDIFSGLSEILEFNNPLLKSLKEDKS